MLSTIISQEDNRKDKRYPIQIGKIIKGIIHKYRPQLGGGKGQDISNKS
jgi:hypothetical protein